MMNAEDNNGLQQEEASASNNTDGNANPNPLDHSKGAIPKTRPLQKPCNKKSSAKLNNNLEELRSLNGKSSEDGLKMNGCFVNGSSNFLEFYKRSYEECSSGKGLERVVLDSDSSSDDTELLSVSDDGCIYTYKGDYVADLPESFFSLVVPVVDNQPVIDRRENSSPEMDFLEMDFDPGTNGDIDSDSVSNADAEQSSEEVSQKVIETPPKEPMIQVNKEPIKESLNLTFSNLPKTQTPKTPKPDNDHINLVNSMLPWDCSLSERTTCGAPRYIKRHQSSTGDLSSPTVTSPAGSENFDGIKQLKNGVKSQSNLKAKKVMIWSEEEATTKQVVQIGPSACGATAVINVLKALRYPVPGIDRLHEVIPTRLRSNDSALCEYLISRSVAGTTHEDLISALTTLTDSNVYARFFPMHPERALNLHKWLAFWLENGAVPVATLNLQKNLVPMPDAWHHQMIYGVGPDGVYLTNPLECVEAEQLWPQLCSESMLLVRREDVIPRWSPAELRALMEVRDVRWRRLNVVGQVANMVREQMDGRRSMTSHIKIPAAYRSGITLAVDVKSPAYTLLSQCPELPLLNPSDTAAALIDSGY